MNLVKRPIRRSVTVVLLLTGFLGFEAPADAQDDDPPPRPTCKPPEDCDDCSEDKVRDSLPEEVMKRVAERIGEVLESDELPQIGASEASKALANLVENVLEDGGSPQDQEVFREHKSALEDALSKSLIDIYKSTFGGGAGAAIPPMLDSPLPASDEPNEFVPPDPSKLTLDDIDPIFNFDKPSLGEALDLVNDLAGGNFSDAFRDFSQRVDEVGLEVKGSAGNGWSYGVSGSVREPFDDTQFQAKIDLRFSSYQGLDEERGLKLNAQVKGTVDTDLNWSFTLGINARFSHCTCCNYSLVSDTAAPLCKLTGSGTNGDGKKFIQVTAQDSRASDSGLLAIAVLESSNATVNVPPIFIGQPGPVVVVATKEDKDQPSIVNLRVTDVAGNATLCDPVIAEIRIRRRGRPVVQTFSNIPEAESRLTLYNQNPGLQTLRVTANGTTFVLRHLGAGEERTIDLSSAMLPGSENNITVQAFGRPGAGAILLIHDSEPSRAAQWRPFMLEPE